VQDMATQQQVHNYSHNMWQINRSKTDQYTQPYTCIYTHINYIPYIYIHIYIYIPYGERKKQTSKIKRNKYQLLKLLKLLLRLKLFFILITVLTILF